MEPDAAAYAARLSQIGIQSIRFIYKIGVNCNRNLIKQKKN